MSSSRSNKKNSTAAKTRRSRVTSKSSGKVAATETRRSSNSVSEKLAALKNLIAPPTTAAEESNGEGREVAVDELFRETLDYILRLRTQVVVLQRFIQLSSTKDADVDSVF